IADILTVGFGAADNLSGVDTVAATLDGAAVADGQAVQLWTLAPGAHTLTVTATDRAGNSQTQTVTFTVQVAYGGLEALKHWFADHGYIDNQGVVNSLDQKLRAARAAHERGQHETEDSILRAFIAEVQAQTGKHIFEPAGSTLASWAQTMIDSH
ncbi:MAG TPA: Ig-like domain-containing protein, partial [Symbiobacteriaceae bacterium]|nr:Ig-like domain-containing protein [Symbiobacteriaceae bacterium]